VASGAEEAQHQPAQGAEANAARLLVIGVGGARSARARAAALRGALPAVLSILAFVPPAGAAPLLPPPGKVFFGGQGGFSGAPDVRAFTRQAGSHPAVYQWFPQGVGGLDMLAQGAADGRARAVLHVNPTNSPGSIAAGRRDNLLLAINRQLAEFGRPVYLRPWSEMNNGNNPYSAYDLRGRPRGPGKSTRAFVAGWRRLAIVVRGGYVRTIDRRLRRIGQRPLSTDRERLPRPKVALLWVPLSFGNPEVASNHPRHWWPGRWYVDWVGTTWYSPFRATSAMEAFYSYPAWNRKPFVFAEFAVWGAESPGFVSQAFDFARSHRRVRMLIYFQSTAMKHEFRLSSHPRSRARLRQELRWRRIAKFAPEYRHRAR
jgi:hypothetical protein